jgi:hypothetical protein
LQSWELKVKGNHAEIVAWLPGNSRFLILTQPLVERLGEDFFRALPSGPDIVYRGKAESFKLCKSTRPMFLLAFRGTDINLATKSGQLETVI